MSTVRLSYNVRQHYFGQNKKNGEKNILNLSSCTIARKSEQNAVQLFKLKTSLQNAASLVCISLNHNNFIKRFACNDVTSNETQNCGPSLAFVLFIVIIRPVRICSGIQLPLKFVSYSLKWYIIVSLYGRCYSFLVVCVYSYMYTT